MSEQTAIPTPPTPPVEGPCAWCGKESAGTIEVRPAGWGQAANGVRVLKRRALVVPACMDHIDIAG